MPSASGKHSFRVAFGCSLFVGIHSMVLAKCVLLFINEGLNTLRRFGYAVVCLLETIVVSGSDAYYRCVKGTLTAVESADRSLINIGFLTPLINIVWHFTLPSFDVTERNWFGYFAYLLLLNSSASGTGFDCNQVPYSVAQWLITGPLMMFLDLRKTILLQSN
ncbi:hypothetical protein CEUSTIGMA_g478.t1 [Chlamydomonas eustigma]|uniref:Uncharacterized protein n=1 Tax=Chlamydomonas eustigma TaxID=1157962 RepID=A0A250WQP8_9CHLO|nr:hypothetical protein CEUSTIGMA_g478.t1 [Chlamydomonas eustigma]|eukprot:GAX73026.1 hypothetical protein CEUSTIGMA_g478.t1 [Chlamydomonas eustigma]